VLQGGFHAPVSCVPLRMAPIAQIGEPTAQAPKSAFSTMR
jgi:hypothetical protein